MCSELHNFWVSWDLNPSNLTPELTFLIHCLVSQNIPPVPLRVRVNHFLRGDSSCIPY